MSEPVAWMTENGTIFDELPPISGGLIPLYTHPMHELTDEEIATIWDDVRKDANLKPNMKDVQEFARAILKKASKK